MVYCIFIHNIRYENSRIFYLFLSRNQFSISFKYKACYLLRILLLPASVPDWIEFKENSFSLLVIHSTFLVLLMIVLLSFFSWTMDLLIKTLITTFFPFKSSFCKIGLLYILDSEWNEEFILVLTWCGTFYIFIHFFRVERGKREFWSKVFFGSKFN